MSEAEIARTDFGAYTEDQFFDDMARVTENRADPDLVEDLPDTVLDEVLKSMDRENRERLEQALAPLSG